MSLMDMTKDELRESYERNRVKDDELTSSDYQYVIKFYTMQIKRLQLIIEGMEQTIDDAKHKINGDNK